ncbi:hypothetical protein [Brevibacillus marinus]|nr:hypothetical protein [Brevibacillus marinus]
MNKMTREQKIKWQRKCVLEDMQEIEREKRADSLDTYLGRRVGSTGVG